MATVLELSTGTNAPQIKLDPSLEEDEQEWRAIYVLARIRARFETDLPTWTSQWSIEQTPAQQMDALVEIFCSGDALTFGHRFKPLNHLGKGIWELKTPDLRFFGWFPHKDCFVGGALDTAFKVKSYNLYAGHAGAVAYFRSQLDLNEPKFVPGDDPSNVVTNFNYP